MNLNVLKSLVPRRVKYTLIADVTNQVILRTSVLDGTDRPPNIINFAGNGDFIALGDHTVRLMEERAGLKDGVAVLDIGCAIGRNATALSRRFKHITYCGFDIVSYGISWCRKKFSDKPSYRFIHADIYNSFYNPRGKVCASAYRFPADDREYDLIFASSVFTHMPPREVSHYLSEISRCLAPHGKGYMTVFIIDEESSTSIRNGKARYSFAYKQEDMYVESSSEPDMAVAYDETTFSTMLQNAGLKVDQFYPGYWRGPKYLDAQDAFVLSRRSS